MTTIIIYQSDDQDIPAETEAYYEALAVQEEIYLEETEEELRLILESEDPPPPQGESPDQLRERAVEELIAGDSDDPPLSEEDVEQLLK